MAFGPSAMKVRELVDTLSVPLAVLPPPLEALPLLPPPLLPPPPPPHAHSTAAAIATPAILKLFK
jgi:hypothetical protein